MNTSNEANDQAVPESLTIAIDKRHHDSLLNWWTQLTDEERAEFLEVAAFTPDEIADPITSEEAESGDAEPNDWYEYIINQDVRFYFDRSDPQGNYNIVYPIMTPVSNAADIEVISHLLTNPRRQKDGS